MWLRLAMRSTSTLLLSLLLLLCSEPHHVSGDEDSINRQENVLKEEQANSDRKTSVKFGSRLAFNGDGNWMMTLGQWIKVRRKSDGGIEVYVVHRPTDNSMNRKKTMTNNPDPEPGDENDVDEFRRRRRRQVLPIFA